MLGPAREVVTAYQAFCVRLEEERLREAAQGHRIRPRSSTKQILRELRLTGSRWGNGRIRVNRVEMVDERERILLGDPEWAAGDRSTPLRIGWTLSAGGLCRRHLIAMTASTSDRSTTSTLSPTELSIEPGEGTIELRLPSVSTVLQCLLPDHQGLHREGRARLE
jgi:hypothetical protein